MPAGQAGAPRECRLIETAILERLAQKKDRAGESAIDRSSRVGLQLKIR